MIYKCSNKKCNKYDVEVYISSVKYMYDTEEGAMVSSAICPECLHEYSYIKRHTGFTKNIPKQGQV